MVNSTGVAINLKVSVAKAIAQKAGPKLEEACEPLAPLNEGSIVVTSGYDMTCTHIIHCNSHYHRHDKDCKVGMTYRLDGNMTCLIQSIQNIQFYAVEKLP